MEAALLEFLFAFNAYGLFDLFGGFITRNADALVGDLRRWNSCSGFSTA
jgi:hypothetical protein